MSLRKWRSGAGLIPTFGLMLAMVGVIVLGGSTALAKTYDSPSKIDSTGANTLNWTGQGGGTDFQTQCSGDTATPGSLLWIFTTDGGAVSGTPSLTVNGDVYDKPDNKGGSWHFVTSWYTTTHPPTNASVSFNVTDTGNGAWVLTISHGCPPAPAKKSVVVNTTVIDAATNAAWAGTEQAPAAAYDTAKVIPPSAVPVPTGTVTYTFFTNSSCSAPGTSAGTVNLGALGVVPNSNTEPNLAAGFYAFQATYSGDTHYLGLTSSCENFSVKSAPGGKKATVTTTTVFNAATNAAWSGAVAPASAYDTAKVVTPSAIPAPTGTVTYTFFNNGTCAGDGTSAGTKTIGLKGSVPNSDTKSALAAGSYAFQASYSGDPNYNPSTSGCEPFTVAAPGDPRTTTTTTIFNASNNGVLSGALALNGSVYDTATVTHVGGLTPTGTISYTFFSNGTCSGNGLAAGTNLALGSKSTTQGPLAAGSYSFKASFTSSNTANFNSSDSSCEPFTVVGGGVLAQTGANPNGLGIALSLLILGMFAIGGALLVLRRSEA